MREITRAQKARLGLFIIISGGLLLATIIVVTGARIFEKRDFYTIRYRDVSVGGLEVGAPVKYHGVRVGRVESIEIDPEEVETVVVTISLNHGTPVKTDVRAVINALSLTGLKIVELEGGSTLADLLPVGSTIPTGASSFEAITGKAEVVTEKLEIVLTNLVSLTGGENQDRLMAMIDNTARVLEDVHIMLEENRLPVANTIGNLEAASQGILEIAYSEELRRVLANLDTASTQIQTADLGRAVGDLRLVLEQARTTLNHFDLTLLKGRHDLLTSLEVLRESLDSFNEFTRIIAEDPSLLLRGRRGGEIYLPVERER